MSQPYQIDLFTGLPVLYEPAKPARKEKSKPQILVPEYKIKKFDTLLLTREVARYLNVTERTILNFKERLLSHSQVSERKIYYLEKDLLKFVNANYHKPLILDDDWNPPPLTMKDKLLPMREVIEFFKGTMSASLLNNCRLERKLGYVQLSSIIYRFPERDLLQFLNKNYVDKLSYEE